MPQIGRVEISIIEEEQSRWLAFNQKELDYLNLPATFAHAGVRRGQSAEAGVGGAERHRSSAPIDPDITLHVLQFPAIRWSAASAGEDRAARARSSWRTTLDEEIRVVRKNQAVAARDADSGRRGRPRSDVPHASTATIPSSRTSCSTTSATRRGKDGYRTLPDGKPLTIKLRHRDHAPIDREHNELWKKSMDAIGVRIDFQVIDVRRPPEGGARHAS